MIGHSVVPHLHLGNSQNIATSHYDETELNNSLDHFLSIMFSNELGEKHLEHIMSEKPDIHVSDAIICLFFLAYNHITIDYFTAANISELSYFNTTHIAAIFIQHFASLLGNYSLPAPPIV